MLRKIIVTFLLGLRKIIITLLLVLRKRALFNMTKYFAVVYCHDETIHLWPGESKEQCLEALSKLKSDPDISRRMKATTVIKRDMENFKDGFIFGNPKCLNVMEK